MYICFTLLCPCLILLCIFSLCKYSFDCQQTYLHGSYRYFRSVILKAIKNFIAWIFTVKEFQFAIYTLGFFTHPNKVLSKPTLGYSFLLLLMGDRMLRLGTEESSKGWERHLRQEERDPVAPAAQCPTKDYNTAAQGEPTAAFLWVFLIDQKLKSRRMTLMRRYFIKYSLWVTEGNLGPLSPFQELSEIPKFTLNDSEPSMHQTVYKPNLAFYNLYGRVLPSLNVSDQWSPTGEGHRIEETFRISEDLRGHPQPPNMEGLSVWWVGTYISHQLLNKYPQVHSAELNEYTRQNWQHFSHEVTLSRAGR